MMLNTFWTLIEAKHNVRPLSLDSAIDSEIRQEAWVHEHPSLSPKLKWMKSTCGGCSLVSEMDFIYKLTNDGRYEDSTVISSDVGVLFLPDNMSNFFFQ